MATLRICDRIGCRNEVESLSWRISKSPYLNPILFSHRVFDICDTCMFEMVGWVQEDGVISG